MLALTIAAWHSAREIEDRAATARLTAQLQQLAIQLRSRLQGYEQILRGGLGLLHASDGVSRQEWNIFVATLALETRFPGIQGVGFAEHIAPEGLEEHVRAVRAQGFPAYRVWPQGERAEYSAIVYLEPFRGRNLRAFGYDMFSEPVRQEAMRRARETGNSAMSGKVQLVQETGVDVQAGFLIYLPYYEGHLDLPASEEERRRTFRGYVYAPFRMKDLLDGLRTDYSDLEFAVFDGVQPDESRLLFASTAWPEFQALPPGERATLELYGRTWTIIASPSASAASRVTGERPHLILGAGLLISLLVSGIVWALAVNRHRAAALEGANRRYQQVVESITDAFFTLDRDWCFTYVSPRAETLLRRASGELLGRPVFDCFPEARGTAFEREVRRALDESVQATFVDYYPPLDTWFDVHVYPHVGGASVFFRDITGRKRSEEALRLRERAVEASVNPVLITDPHQPDNPIIYVNPAFERVTGYAAAEALGRNCRFLQGEDGDQPALEQLRALIREQREGRVLLRNYKKNGELFWNELYIGPVRDERGRVTHFLGVQNDITAARRQRQQLEHQATHDALTGLPNRALLRDRIARALAQSERRRQPVAVIFIDLDDFKAINDTLGHEAGDQVLRTLAERLQANVRQADTVARLGGDEFVIVLADDESVHDVAQVTERIMAVISRPLTLAQQEISMTCSAGISVYPDDGEHPDVLLKNADAAMYQAKEAGRSQKQFYAPGINDRIARRLELTNSLRQALERGEFVLHYQPQFELERGSLVGFEVLLRWQHRERGLISPADFIPLAEETGLIVPIGEWVLETACAFYGSLRQAALPPVVMSVNLSARQLRHRQLVQAVRAALERTALAPQCLEFEVTESTVMHDVDEVLAIFADLKAAGVKLAMDDFGTGYSSLAYLKRFPVDRLKIDRSFVRDITVDAEDAAIAQAIISLAHTLGVRVVAEGVETEAQLHLLRRFGCDEAQGYYFARPMDAEAFRRFAARAASGPSPRSG